ncbi:hypothetical protein TBLA_0F03240 [Henningerozyma blattae CBS 6284]|uniref:Amino acid permease/ SLC12A domain-containing protein n=1 Tax=Henningerozyma blattae (strain ATCC 34711 / CBS 6284 / DSM 70876 / NBRC 10599 / NRRL Y-10934 / UCD 77-7) TaxID=1071380 RepID=I2H660_HENB6|nr:hypothetical protein TBLA_0F03240 [Tetrapisispora blattae CBS 6284]CCH61862.1 hypothetical protein TBLA_0F03240 [Tetrapisispora blattae CBS 6284]
MHTPATNSIGKHNNVRKANRGNNEELAKLLRNDISGTTIIDQSVESIGFSNNSVSEYPDNIYPEPAFRESVEDATQRRLLNRHVQFIAISGVIGTALFVAIGKPLYRGGPGSLLLAFILWCVPILCITVSTAEMVCFLPISSPFLRLANKCVDNSMAMMASWNFWVLECVQIPLEIVSVNTIIQYWTDNYSPAFPLLIQVLLYLLISFCAVKYYGELEFWLASFKIILAIGLFCFTFFTILGANPKHDRYGFRNFSESPFKTYFPNGNTSSGDMYGYFHGFANCLIQASFTMAGGEYISMLAGEVKLPREVLPKAFKQVFYRLTIIFIGSCICVGLICSPNDKNLTASINEARPGAGSSPYVIAMNNLGIRIVPDIVNGGLITAAFSAGNAYTYCSSRTLYGMALDGYAPKIFTTCTKNGVPLYAVGVSLLWAVLSLLQLNSNSAIVLNWLINLVTASQLINFVNLCIIYLFFRKAYLLQKDSLPELPFKSWGQPFTAYFGLFSALIMTFVQGYTVFYSNLWTFRDFLFCYFMVFLDIGLYIYCKIFQGPDEFKSPENVDFATDLKEIEAHELNNSFDDFKHFHA